MAYTVKEGILIMPTIKEQIKVLTSLQHTLAVWEALAEYLDETFLPQDGKMAPKAIRADGCVVEIVPEDVVDSVFMSIGKTVEGLKRQIDEAENMEMVPAGKKEA
jgi:hypothetical protein